MEIPVAVIAAPYEGGLAPFLVGAESVMGVVVDPCVMVRERVQIPELDGEEQAKKA